MATQYELVLCQVLSAYLFPCIILTPLCPFYREEAKGTERQSDLTQTTQEVIGTEIPSPVGLIDSLMGKEKRNTQICESRPEFQGDLDSRFIPFHLQEYS